MRILTNKEEIINQFEYFIDEILNKKDMKISDLTKNNEPPRSKLTAYQKNGSQRSSSL